MKGTIALLLVLLYAVINSSPLYADEVLTWQQCVSEARKNHPDLLAARSLLEQTEAEKRITAGSRLPKVSLGLGVQELHNAGTGTFSSSSYTLSAQQLLYDGHKTSAQLDSNSEAITVSRYNERMVSANVRFALRSAFTAVLKAQHLVFLTRELADRRQKNLRLISLRYKGGREHSGSLRKAEADLALATFEVAQAERSLVLARTTLLLLLGRDIRQPIKVQGAFAVTVQDTEKPDFVQLAGNTPLVHQLAARSRAAQYDLAAARSAFSPQLYLTSSFGRSTHDRLPVDALDLNAGLTLSVPIYEGGSGRARVAKAVAVLNQQHAQEKSGSIQMLDALEQSWKAFRDAQQMVAVQKKFLEAAVERATIATAQYANSLISFNDWVLIEDNLVNANKAYLNAEADMLIAEAQWIQSKGGGLDGDQE